MPGVLLAGLAGLLYFFDLAALNMIIREQEDFCNSPSPVVVVDSPTN